MTKETDWEGRYQAGDTPWEKGEASPGLVDFLSKSGALARIQGKNKKETGLITVAVPGCGTGHDVRVWAKAGFQVMGFDLAPSAIKLARAKTAEGGLKAEFRQRDFLRDEPPWRFDWIFEHTLFCAIDPDDRDKYVRAVLRWLKPEGTYLAVNYLIPDEDGPPFGTTREEQMERFSPQFKLVKDWVPRSYPNRTGLERMFWWKRKPKSKV
jgi:SAM-dependent methyltransferase